MGPDSRLNMTNSMSDKEVSELNIDLLDAFRKNFNFITPISLKKMKPNIYQIKIKCPFCNQIITYKNCFIENRLTYGFHLICRNCHMRSVLVGPIKKIAYQHYTKTRTLRNYYIRMKKNLRKKDYEFI